MQDNILRFLYRVLLFITYCPYLFIYNILTAVETFVFIFNNGREVSFMSAPYRDFMMKVFFQKIYDNGVMKVNFNGLKDGR